MGKQSRLREQKRAASETRVNVATAAALAAAIVAVYAQVHSHAFINYDDPAYITRNPNVLQGLSWANVRWAVTSSAAGYWHPLTWLSHMLDVSLFGRDAGAHLLVNVVLHAATAVLLYAWLRTARLDWLRSTTVAALFALHPLRVESVAWAAERKDVLSALFFVLCLLFYTRFAQTRSRPDYALSLAALALGLLSKPMLVTTPFVLLLIDWWPLQRLGDWKRALLEKIPHFALILPFLFVTMKTQSAAISASPSLSFSVRVANALQSYVRYLGKTIWPAKLAVLYPYEDVSAAVAIVCAIVLVGITGAAIYYRHRFPAFVTGWFWYLGTLVPVIGLVQAGLQSMADRFTYIPHIGLFLAIVFSIRPRRELVYAAAAAVAAFSLVTIHQLGYWKDSRTLFEHTLAVTNSGNKLAQQNLAGALLDEGDYAGAEPHFRAAIGLPAGDLVHAGLALALSGQGKLEEAAKEARLAVEANPKNMDALDALGSIELARGNTAEAEKVLGRTSQQKNDPAVLARLALAKNDLPEAQKRFAEAVAANPEDAILHNSYAAVLARSGSDALAASEYETALRLSPAMYDARMNYAALLSRIGRNEEALRELDAAAKLRPRSPEPLIYLALVEANGNRFADAAAHVQQAMEIDRPASNRFLTEAIRVAPAENNIDQYLGFLRARANGR